MTKTSSVIAATRAARSTRAKKGAARRSAKSPADFPAELPATATRAAEPPSRRERVARDASSAKRARSRIITRPPPRAASQVATRRRRGVAASVAASDADRAESRPDETTPGGEATKRARRVASSLRRVLRGGVSKKKKTPPTRLRAPPLPGRRARKKILTRSKSVRRLSSLASPRAVGTPMRDADASAMATLLEGHIDTFGTCLPERVGGVSGVASVSSDLRRGASTGANGKTMSTFFEGTKNKRATSARRGRARLRAAKSARRLAKSTADDDDQRSLPPFSPALSTGTAAGLRTPRRAAASLPDEVFSYSGGPADEAWGDDGEWADDEDARELAERERPELRSPVVAWTPASPAPERRRRNRR